MGPMYDGEDYRSNASSAISDARWTGWQVFYKLILPACLVLMVFGFVLKTCSTAAKVASAPGEVIEKTFEADNIVYNYEWFKRQHNVIIGQKKQIETAHQSVMAFEKQMEGAPRAKWDSDDKREYDTRLTILEGLRKTCIAAASDYNAHAQMANRDIFRTDTPSTETCE